MSVLRNTVDFKTIITFYYAYFSRVELKIGKSITIFNDLPYLIYPLELYSVLNLLISLLSETASLGNDLSEYKWTYNLTFKYIPVIITDQHIVTS